MFIQIMIIKKVGKTSVFYEILERLSKSLVLSLPVKSTANFLFKIN